MSMRPEDFNALTPAEFIYAWQGYAERQTTQLRSDWERTRYQTWIFTSIQLDRKDRKPMTEMFPLPWEKAQQPTQPTEPTMQERADRVHEILNQFKR